MAPYPDELDVFTVPHSRMKQLVHKYLDLVSAFNFRDASHMTTVLEMLCHTFHVFKTHEQIENRFIMRRLKEKLTALDITDAAVCNCHSDNRLTEMMSMVLDGYRWAQKSESERINYGRRLRSALEDFTQDFIPHMKEEEEVFQPMLIEYFSYEELKELKAKVIQQHQQKVEEADIHEKYIPECDSDKEEDEAQQARSLSEQVPTEVMMKILSYLSPRDLSRCAQVSKRWNHLALDSTLWPAIYPVEWAAGNWSFQPHKEGESNTEENDHLEEGENCYFLDDEDADKDESSDSESSEDQADTALQQTLHEVHIISGLVKHVLPRVGSGVQQCNLAYSRGISSSLVHKILKLCPNLRLLNLTNTRITDAAFKEYGLKEGTSRLEHLNLSNCGNITDNTLQSLAGHRLPTEDLDSTASYKGKNGVLSSLSTIVEVSISDHKFTLPENDPVIDQDLSLMDLPVDLCALDCLDICLETAPSFCRMNGCQTKDFISCCSLKRTCNNNEIDFIKTCCGGGFSEQKNYGMQYEVDNINENPHALHKLTYLNLNSCFRITDNGLKVLSARGGLPQLHYLDLSGCLGLTGVGVASLVDTCQSLDHASLFYCDNICPDPFPETASGCRNLECGSRVCCRSGK